MDVKIHLKLRCSLSKQFLVSVPWTKWKSLHAAAALGTLPSPFFPFVEMVHTSASWDKNWCWWLFCVFSVVPCCVPLSPLSNSCRLPFQWRFMILGLRHSRRSATSQELPGLVCLLCPFMGPKWAGSIFPRNPQYLCEVSSSWRVETTGVMAPVDL